MATTTARGRGRHAGTALRSDARSLRLLLARLDQDQADLERARQLLQQARELSAVAPREAFELVHRAALRGAGVLVARANRERRRALPLNGVIRTGAPRRRTPHGRSARAAGRRADAPGPGPERSAGPGAAGAAPGPDLLPPRPGRRAPAGGPARPARGARRRLSPPGAMPREGGGDGHARGDGRTGGDPGILHLDMDAFFCLDRVRDDPSLQGCPSSSARGARGSWPRRATPPRARHPLGDADGERAPPGPRLVIVRPDLPLPQRLRSGDGDPRRRGRGRRADQRRRGLPGRAAPVASSASRPGSPSCCAPGSARARPASSVGGSVSRAVAKIASARAKPDGDAHRPADRTADPRPCPWG